MKALSRDGSGIPAAPPLRVRLLGGFSVTRDGGAPSAQRWARPSARTLVKLLAVAPGHRLHREEVMSVCWPEADARAAAGSLRVALHAARHALEPELPPRAASSYLVADGALLSLAPGLVRVDADEAESAARAALRLGRMPELSAALGLFTGELLPEDRYAHWAAARRGQLALLRERLLLRLAEGHLDAAPERAAAFAQQVLAASPAEELAHRVLIDALLRQGLRRRAVHQYHVCREALDTELGVRPAPETERLHRAALAAAPAPLPTAPPLPAPVRGVRRPPAARTRRRAGAAARPAGPTGPAPHR
ncbi:BTAD domain-containing putative transcriptional regulator [Streptomyces sp. NPDC060243]|uniref:AfsR/SARP family transcriptional regulator n=1 Tax=Streptomyces sp. NPDC060243 TaxID=3347081 RepID=UPI003661CD40